MLVTSGGMLIRMKVGDISVIGRNTQGVRLISLENAGEKVTGLSRLPEEADTNGGGEERNGEGEPPGGTSEDDDALKAEEAAEAVDATDDGSDSGEEP